VTWTSSSTTTATISSGGLAAALKAASTTISAIGGGISGCTTLTVTAATLASTRGHTSEPIRAAGKAQQFTATCSDSSTADAETNASGP